MTKQNLLVVKKNQIAFGVIDGRIEFHAMSRIEVHHKFLLGPRIRQNEFVGRRHQRQNNVEDTVRDDSRLLNTCTIIFRVHLQATTNFMRHGSFPNFFLRANPSLT